MRRVGPRKLSVRLVWAFLGRSWLLHLHLRVNVRGQAPRTMQLFLHATGAATRRCSEAARACLTRQAQLHQSRRRLLSSSLLIKEPLVVLLALQLVHLAALFVKLIPRANAKNRTRYSSGSSLVLLVVVTVKLLSLVKIQLRFGGLAHQLLLVHIARVSRHSRSLQLLHGLVRRSDAGTRISRIAVI